MGAHARLSPSAAERWLTCPGSVSLDDPEEEDPSEFAAEGTVAHLIRAECLSLGLEPEEMTGHVVKADGFTFTVDREMVEHLRPGIERVRSHNAARMDIEYRTDLREWIEDGFGTTDVGLVVYGNNPEDPDTDLIVIDDLKYGQGVAVSPVENKQLMIYALGYWWNVARHLTQTKRFLLRIDQPRISGAGGEWETDLDHLMEFAETVLRPGAKRAMSSSKLQASTKGCRWCRLQKKCQEYTRFNMEVMSQRFDDVTDLSTDVMVLPDKSVLTPERRGYILRHKTQIEAWLDDLHTQALADALQGTQTPGLKVVEGKRPPRKWKDEAKVAEALATHLLKDAIYTEPQLISVAVAEKLIGKATFKKDKALNELIEQGVAKPILVDETDPKPALQSFADKFAELTADDPKEEPGEGT